MRLILSIADLRPEMGGPSRSVPALGSALAALGCEVTLASLYFGAPVSDPAGAGSWEETRRIGDRRSAKPVGAAAASETSSPAPANDSTARLHYRSTPCTGAPFRRMKWSPAFGAMLRSACGTGHDTVLHDNGVWLPTNHTAAQVARQAGIPFMVSPRGMLTAWSFRYKGFKKRLAWWLYQQRDLRTATVLHATSRAEADDLRQLGLPQPIAIVPNGVELPPLVSGAPPSAAAWVVGRSKAGEDAGAPVHGLGPNIPDFLSCQPASLSRSRPIRTALFLSRIHPKKGLLDLVEAWAAVRPTGWRVGIAGGDELNHRAEVEAAIRERNVSDAFEFVGELRGDDKWRAYRAADLFILPTKSENFGIVIAEALACGVPVITTRGTPWEELVTERCGWWTEIGAEPLVRALREAVALSDEERQAMGQRGRQLVEERYTWPAAAGKMLAVYEWMLGRQKRPEWVLS